MDSAVDPALGLVEKLLSVAYREAKYCTEFTTNVQELGVVKEKLRSTKGNVGDRAKKAKSNSKDVDEGIKKLLEGTDKLIAEVEQLEQRAEANKSCFGGRCPNLICRYYLGRKLVKQKEEMEQLNGELSPLKQFSRLRSLRDERNSEFIKFKCTEKAYHEIQEALEDNEAKKIGVYGMGGCGKTTLVHNLIDEVRKSNRFYKVCFATVKQERNIISIQDEIASWLGLSFTVTEKTVQTRAMRLSMALNTGEKILIVLDDVWNCVDLSEQLGITFENNSGCRVLLTTRKENVCDYMKCQKKISLSLLTNEESWNLFKRHAEIKDKKLKGVAKKIAKLCGNLPVAIEAVARTLKEKSEVEWKNALKNLENFKPVDIPEELEINPYKSLLLSYDNLKNEVKAQLLFLLCSVFPEDSEILIEDLIRLATGLGLFEQFDSYEEVRINAVEPIHKLIDCSLLLQVKEGQSVKMHDLLRSLALWIAKEDVKVIIEQGSVLKKLAKSGEVTKLYCKNMNEFPDKLNCPELELLVLRKDVEGSFELPDTFFQGIEKLKVLTVEFSRLTRKIPALMVPQSINSLSNLHTLCLRGCQLNDTSFLRNLEKIESLEFCNCTLKLANEIAQLKKLRLLDISRSSIVEGNPYEVLGSCSQLEELYFSENKLKSKLEDRKLAKFFLGNCSSSPLQRYHLQIGDDDDIIKNDLSSRILSIGHVDLSTSTEKFKYLVQKAEVLFLKKIHGGVKNIIPDMVQAKGAGSIESVEILLCDSNEIECLLDTTGGLYEVKTVFSKLTMLTIRDMAGLEAISHGNPPPDLFNKLKKLQILKCSKVDKILFVGKLNLHSLTALELEECPGLTSLFTPAVAWSLKVLEVLTITKCDGLKHIITDEEEGRAEIISDEEEEEKAEISSDEEEEKAEIISNEEEEQRTFHSLKRILVNECKKMEYLMPVSFARGLKKFEDLGIQRAPQLKYVFGQSNREDQLPSHNQKAFDLPLLKVLDLKELPEIIKVFPENCQEKFPSLENVILTGCPKFRNSSTDTSMTVSDLEVRQQATKQVDVITSKTCCFGRCPNWVWRYRVGKQPTNKTQTITKHNQDSDLKEFARRPSLPGMAFYSSDSTFFDSRKTAYDQLLEALNDDQVSMVGLYGMGGCGKTTLVKQVVIKAMQFFDEVVFTVVSQSVDVRRIQDTIAGVLGLALEEEDEWQRARRLWLRLTEGQKILIILDDVWAKLDFEIIGIPFGENHKGCRVLLTTRRKELCNLMGCQRQIPLGILTDEEAWTLFQEYARITDETPNSLKQMAQEITKECGGLPLAITAIANTLKGKSIQAWKESLQAMRNSTPLATQVDKENVYKALKLSYDYLGSEAKSLFLLCSLFPEDYEISVEDVTIFSIGLGLFGDVDSYQISRAKVHVAIKKLVDSCLLTNTDAKGYIKMHDLIRDVALSIANKEIQVIQGPTENPRALEEGATRYLYCHQMNDFPSYQLNFPKLEILLFGLSKEGSVEVSERCFEGMKNLRVLALKCEYKLRQSIQIMLPRSIVLLTNLRTIRLVGLAVADISILEQLRRLETLELDICSRVELPIEIVKLTKLRLLSLTRCKIKRNPYQVIGKVAQIEELYFMGNECNDKIKWEIEDVSIPPLLKRYHIDIQERPANTLCNSVDGGLISRAISIEHFDASCTNATIMDLVQRAQILHLIQMQGGYRAVVPELIEAIRGDDMNELIELRLNSCFEIECLIDATYVSSQMSNLELLQPFHSIRKMELLNCPKLKSLFTQSIASTMLLEELTIKECHALKHIITNGRDYNDHMNYASVFQKLRKFTVWDCYSLEIIFPATYVSSQMSNLELLQPFHSIRKMELLNCPKLKSLFTRSIASTMLLEELTIKECHALRHIITDGRDYHDHMNYDSVFPELRKLTVWDCHSLEIIFPATSSGGLINLESIEIRNAPQLEYLFRQYHNEDHLYHQNHSSEIQIDLPASEGRLCLPQLITLVVKHCNKLKCLCSISTSFEFPNLELLLIEEAAMLEVVFGGQQGETEKSDVLWKLRYLVLIMLPRLANVFQGIDLVSTVEYRVVRDCPKLALSPTIGLEDLREYYKDKEIKIGELDHRYLVGLLDEMIESSEDSEDVDFEVDVEVAPQRELSPSQPQRIKETAEESKQEDHKSEKAFVVNEVPTSDKAKSVTEIVEEGKTLEKSKIVTCLTHSELGSTSQELVQKESRNETIKIDRQGVNGSVEEGPTSEKAELKTSPTNSEPGSSLSVSSVTSPHETAPQSIIKDKAEEIVPKCSTAAESAMATSSTEPELKGPSPTTLHGEISVGKTDQTYANNDTEADSINLQDFEEDDLLRIFQTMEEGANVKDSMPSVSVFPAKHPALEDNHIAKAFNDLEASLKIPLKDIASSKDNRLLLENALNVLSYCSSQDGVLLARVKATIDSLHQNFPTILSSFKEASASIDEFKMLEKNEKFVKEELLCRKEEAITLLSNISKTEKSMAKAQQKEEGLKEQISSLQLELQVTEKEINDCKVNLSSLQERKKKLRADAIGFQKEFNAVTKHKSEKWEDQRKAQQKLFKVNYEWSALCSQFEQDCSAARNPS